MLSAMPTFILVLPNKGSPWKGYRHPRERGCNPIQPTESCGEVWSYHASLRSRRTTFEHWQAYVSASGTREVRQIFPVFSTLAAVGRLDYILFRGGDGLAGRWRFLTRSFAGVTVGRVIRCWRSTTSKSSMTA